jgi:tRNA-2-methylthio-N6-dimethylallyladenosine synthase
LQQRIAGIAADISRSMVGTVQRVLVDGFSRKSDSQVSGRTENNRVVNFDGGRELIGQFVRVRITEALPNSLRAELLAAGEAGTTVLRQKAS